jgi:excisionase family DNA binding protein
MPATPEFLTIDDVARALGVSTRTVRRWIQSGQLVAHRIRRVVRIAPADLDAFLRGHPYV